MCSSKAHKGLPDNIVNQTPIERLAGQVSIVFLRQEEVVLFRCTKDLVVRTHDL